MTAPQTPSFPSVTTRTTVLIAGENQQVRLDVTSALTAAAAVFATVGAVRMVFTDLAVVRGVVAVLRRPVADGVTTVLPEQFLLRPERFAAGEHLVTVHWSQVPPSKITPVGRSIRSVAVTSTGSTSRPGRWSSGSSTGPVTAPSSPSWPAPCRWPGRCCSRPTRRPSPSTDGGDPGSCPQRARFSTGPGPRPVCAPVAAEAAGHTGIHRRPVPTRRRDPARAHLDRHL
ncbi:hypothetical protein ACFQZK_01115 [Rhodococcus aetherivorans]